MGMLEKVVGLVVAMILIGALMPVAINSIEAGLNASWTSAIKTMWQTLSIIGVVSVFVALIYSVLKKGD